MACALAHCSPIGLLEGSQLPLAADHRRVEPPRTAGHVSLEAEEPVGADRRGLALEAQRLDLRDLDGIAHEHVRRLAEQDLAGRRGLLEALGDVDRIAGRKALPAAGVACDDLASVDTGPDCDRHAPVPRELLVERREAFAHLHRSPNRPQRIVLVDDRNPENGHHGVTDELLDDSLVALDDGLHLVEVAAHHASQRLRVELFAERSRSRDVRKDHRHGLSHLAGGLFGHERCPARAAEREALWVLLTAAGARNHAAESSFRRMMSQ